MGLKTIFLVNPSRTTRIACRIRKALCNKKLCNNRHCKTSAAQPSGETEPKIPSIPVAQSFCFEVVEQQIDASTGSTTELAPPTTSTKTETITEVKSETITIETRPTTPDTASQSANSQSPISRQVHNASMHHNLDKAIAEYEAATELLSQRHATLGTQPAAAARYLPLGASPKTPARLRHVRSVSLPPRASAPAHQSQQSQTASDACTGYQRRQLIKDIAYRAAVENCEAAVAFIDRLNAHSTLKARHADTGDLALSFDGTYIFASQFGNVEWKWVSRFNAARNNAHLVERRLLSPDDYEIIFTQLFPTECGHLYKPEHFEVFVTGLGEEGALTKQQAKHIVALGLSVEELDGGAHFTGPSRSRYADRNDPSAIALFDIPKQPCRSIATYSNGPTKYLEQDLFYYLRILAEAAVYNQSFWKGYFIPNARSLIRDFHEAYTITEDGWSLPPNLTDFKRPWTYREVRLLQRAYIIGRMLDMWEAGHLTDFGILRAVRGTYLHIPMQSFWSVEDLESFLYSRVTDSGLPVSKIPEILALHPENDGAFAKSQTRNAAMRALVHRSQEFEEEEEQRLSQIEKSLTSFETIMKAQMTPWQRVKAKFRKMCGKEKKLPPFDPFAPEHETQKGICTL